MLVDIVVDTNVLMHCSNPDEQRCADALAVVTALLNGNQLLCVDEGFDTVESRNRSVIGAEYLHHLAHGSAAHHLIIHLASVGRIRVLPKRPDNPTRRRINQCIRNNRDRVFVGVAWNSNERTLVSHDFSDFSEEKRRHILRETSVRILESCECLPHLAA